ncbi:MAG TPA: UvrD-helicase domain-containing protein, partial [Bacillota bacterium]
TAGAGTGKTSVLVGKYMQLLVERRAQVGEIVAITFTKKAAAEMRERIRLGLQQHLERAGDTEADFWKSQLSQVETARISTFHSFCLGLIREHPLEIGIPPMVGILGEGEATIYLKQSIETVLAEVFRGQNQDNSELFRILLEFGWDSFETSLAGLYETIRESGIPFDEAEKRSRIELKAAIAAIPESVTELSEAVSELLEYSRDAALTERAMELMAALRESWPALREAITNGAVLDETLPALSELSEALPRNQPNSIKERVGAIRDMAEGLSRKLLNQEALCRLPAFREILERVDAAYRRLKQDLGCLDFTDQLILARDLLRNHPDLAEEIRGSLCYLLVDEFQDTNGLQMELVQLLWGETHPGGRFMAVGDIKQSIYRFRGAEADLILKLADELREATQGRLISLSRNYRSSGRVIQFVNALSMPLFMGEPFTYEPLLADEPQGTAAVEFLLTGDFDRRIEAKLVGKQIQQLVSSVPDRETAWHYGDIVLLFRTKTAIPLYQKVFQEMGIPYYSASSSGFYRCLEVTDQLNLLRVTLQRYDGVALMALLTSAYVGLNDECLFWLGTDEGAHARDLVGRFYAADFPAELPTLARYKLGQFRELLIYLQEHRDLLGIPGILRAALERTHYREMLQIMPNSIQRQANLDKLLAKADEFVAKGFHDLHRFLDYLEKLETAEVIEGEASTQAEAGDVVRLMTIHRAKGLEFPVVIIPDLDRQFSRGLRGRLAFHKNTGIGFTIRYGDGENGAPSHWEQLKALNRREEIAELKRLLYVALTRAKQLLILAGSGCNSSKAKTIETADNWMKWFQLLLPLEGAGAELDWEGVPLRIIRDLPASEVPPKAQLLIEAHRAELSTGIPGATAQAEMEIASTALAGQERSLTLKVTEVLTFKSCSRRYFWKYRMRFPEDPAPIEGWDSEVKGPSSPAVAEQAVTLEAQGIVSPVATGSAERSYGSAYVLRSGESVRGLGTRIGTFVHQAIRGVASEWPETLWSEVFYDLPGPDKEQLKRDLQQIWRNFRNSPFTEQAGQFWDEVPFRIKLGEKLKMEGRFDRLLMSPDGKLILVDYKTHRSSAAKVPELAKGYLWQLQLYAMAVKALWGRLPDRAVLYFIYSNQTFSVPLTPEALRGMESEIREIGQFIAVHDRAADYPSADDCKGCGYSWCCKL